MRGDESVAVPLIHQPGKAFVMREPLGTVLVIAPFNYPLRLILFPLIGALAAGNAVVLKPSEVSAHCARALAALVPQHLDPRFVRVVAGGVPQTTALLAQRWDFIFYTGAPAVGRIVMQAAARHLTPVCLELGGKSPVYVGQSCDLQVAARRLLYGKFSNAGQTCVAPDYLLVHPAVLQPLLDAMKATLREWFGEDPQQSRDLGRIVSARHLQRLAVALRASLAAGQDVQLFHGGKVDADDLYIEPTIVVGSPAALGASPLMQDEIFGPILPVMPCADHQEFIRLVNARAKPLALYVFSSDDAEVRAILAGTSSGGVCVNDTIMQITIPEMPFGGVGTSGFGAYNGKHTFELLSHRKSVLYRQTWGDAALRYPPYTESKQNMTRRLLNFKLPPLPSLTTTLTLICSSYLGYQLYLRRNNIIPAWQRLHSSL